MARVKKGVNAHKRHKKILKLAKGFYGAKSKQFKAANPAVMRSLRSAYVGRKLKKRQYRQMWIARINAAARMNGISYSQLMNGLKKSGIEINRKMLSEMAIYDAPAFAALCDTAKKAVKAVEIDEMWHFIQKKQKNTGHLRLLIEMTENYLLTNVAIEQSKQSAGSMKN